jgi:hypothetical protein
MINYSKTLVFFNIYLLFFVPYAAIPANAARLGLTAAQLTDLAAFLAAWNPAYLAYLNPATYGRVNTAQINALYRLYKTYTDGLKMQMKTSPTVFPNELDKVICDIHTDASRRRNIPIPTEDAGVSSKKVNHLNNEFRTFDLADPADNAKPPGTKRIKVMMLILESDKPVPTLADLLPEMESGSMIFDIPFTVDMIGKICYIAVCFSNDSGDGNYSAILATPII